MTHDLEALAEKMAAWSAENEHPHMPTKEGALMVSPWMRSALNALTALGYSIAGPDKVVVPRDNPINDDFWQGVAVEAKHQRARWGEDHDANKTPDDWLWVIAFLTTKAAQAARYGDMDKYHHHIITAAAALRNWHDCAMLAAAQGGKG